MALKIRNNRKAHNGKNPFSIHDAIEEAKRLEADPKTKRYTDMDEMWADLDK